MTSIYFFRSLLGLLILFCCTTCFSQVVTRRYVDSAFKTIETNYRQERDVLYVINGIPFDTTQLEAELEKHDLKHLIEMTFLKCEKIGLMHCYKDPALILFAYNQKNKKKRKAWRIARQFFSNNSDKTVLLVDNSIIDTELSKKKFNSLRLKDIMYIDTTQKNHKSYVRIWSVN